MSSTDDAANDDEARMYASEKEDNFRWVARWLATTSSHVLTEGDRVDQQVEDAVSALAEFAEIAHGSMDPAWILDPQNRKILARDGFPLAGYRALAGMRDGELLENIILVEKFKGNIGNLQGYTALRMNPSTAARQTTDSGTIKPQVILAFSGTSNLTHGLYDLMMVPVQYQPVSNSEGHHDWKIHDGFQRVFQSIREPAIQALKLAIKQMEKEAPNGEWDLVITAHSLGSAVSSLFLLDLLRFEAAWNKSHLPGGDPEMPIIPSSTKVTIAKFGHPRVVNSSLADEYRAQIRRFRQRPEKEEALTDWNIIGYMDGIPAAPPIKFGYVHLCERPFYLYHGRLYYVPDGEYEHTLFTVEEADPQRETDFHPPLFPKGGHNYYGSRDMERLQRRMKAIMPDVKEERTNSQPAQSGSGQNSEGDTSGGSKSPPQHNDPTWVKHYLEREKEEALAWASKAREKGKNYWGLLRSILPITVLILFTVSRLAIV
ncbi:hypothetical protein FRC14_004751 [Serendipita sp. 396]|nr:hypothetical protein FRC14_004751 [Serendipita sp. 396]KAG8878722.1 hypothetical protein FRC20_006399 [Serendipita sp. 405]